VSDYNRVSARSLYPEPTTQTRPAGVAKPRRDGCPKCLIRDNIPRNVGYASGGYYASYRCPTCHHTWWTAWGYEPAEVA